MQYMKSWVFERIQINFIFVFNVEDLILIMVKYKEIKKLNKEIKCLN